MSELGKRNIKSDMFSTATAESGIDACAPNPATNFFLKMYREVLTAITSGITF